MTINVISTRYDHFMDSLQTKKALITCKISLTAVMSSVSPAEAVGYQSIKKKTHNKWQRRQ